jgi:hypothetical protein
MHFTNVGGTPFNLRLPSPSLVTVMLGHAALVEQLPGIDFLRDVLGSSALNRGDAQL